MTTSRLESVARAKKAIASEGLSLRKAAERYGLPKSTLYDQVCGRKCGAGRPTVLTYEEEKSVARSCQELARLGFGLDRFLVGKVIRNYLINQGRETPFKDGVPGQKWWTGFLRRWPSMSERKPQHFPTNRANASTPEVMDQFFTNLKVNKTKKIAQ